MMDFLPLIMLVILAAFGYILFQPVRQIMRLRSLPTLPIAALPHSGQVKVTGRAGGDEVLSPISDTPCVLWQVEVQECHGSTHARHWVTIRKQTSSQPIEIDDGAGRIWAVPSDAEFMLGDDLQATRDALSTMTPQIQAALERMGIPPRGAFGTRRFLRVYERRIALGEPIFAFGLAEEAAGQLRLVSTHDAPLILTDRSEPELLRALYREVAVSMFCAAVAVGFIVWLMIGGRLW